MHKPVHTPVMVAEALEHLRPRPGGRCVDATIGGGGHTQAILNASAPDGCVLGIDRDPALVTALRTRLAAEVDCGRLQLVAGSFAEMSRILAARDFKPVDGILFDLGLSSYHLDHSGRGFSFTGNEPLDMRFDPSDDRQETAAAIVATRSADQLTTLFRTYGEERFASRIARSIVARRREGPLRTTAQILAIIEQTLPATTRWRAGRHAARIFQALRIDANDELAAVAEALPQALAALVPGGRLVVISFHSLEDRLVKNFFRDQQRAERIRRLNTKPLRPADDELAVNPRAASAKLRSAERI